MWLKFNIYSNLLMSLVVLSLSLAYFLFVNGHWVCSAALLIPAIYCFKKASDIYCRYQYKCDVYQKMVRKASARYDRRYFIAYMGTPCMRNVCFFALRKIGHRDDYRVIYKLYKRGRVRAIDVWYEDFEKPKTISVKYVNGEMKFTEITKG